MGTDRQQPAIGESAAVPQSQRRKLSVWPAVLLVVSVGLVGGGVWWYHHTPEQRYSRGRAALSSGDGAAVLREAAHLLETPGFEPQGRLLRGLLLTRAGQPQKALPELLIASREESTAVEAMTAAAECFYVTGRFADSIQTARSALDLDPDCLDARRWLASSYYDLGATLDAVGELKVISEKAPHDARSERLLGLIAKDSERFEEAVEHYRESLRRQPDQPDRQDILLELAESLVELSRFQEALEMLRESNRTVASVAWEAECAHNLGRTEDALKLFDEALTLDPEHVPALLKRGTLSLSLGDAEGAIVTLTRAASLAPQSSQVHFQLSKAYGLLGERDKADDELRLMQQAQELEREFSDLHAAAADDPNDVEVRYRIGELAERLGKQELARLWYRAALALNPSHRQAQEALVRLDSEAENP